MPFHAPRRTENILRPKPQQSAATRRPEWVSELKLPPLRDAESSNQASAFPRATCGFPSWALVKETKQEGPPCDHGRKRLTTSANAQSAKGRNRHTKTKQSLRNVPAPFFYASTVRPECENARPNEEHSRQATPPRSTCEICSLHVAAIFLREDQPTQGNRDIVRRPPDPSSFPPFRATWTAGK